MLYHEQEMLRKRKDGTNGEINFAETEKYRIFAFVFDDVYCRNDMVIVTK